MRRMWACRAVLLAVLCYAYTVHSMLESEDDVPPTMSLEELLQSEEMTTLDSTTCDATPSDSEEEDLSEPPSPQSSPAASVHPLFGGGGGGAAADTASSGRGVLALSHEKVSSLHHISTRVLTVIVA